MGIGAIAPIVRLERAAGQGSRPSRLDGLDSSSVRQDSLRQDGRPAKRGKEKLTDERALRPGSRGLAAGRMLAVAAELDLVAGLFAVFAAVFAKRAMRFDHTLARRVRAFGCGHTA